MDKANMKAVLQKYTMIIVLVLVTLFFTWKTGGKILLPQNISNLISQNAYVFVLATGMLLCILTGGNIDLSVGSVVCFVGAVGAVLMENYKMNMGVAVIAMLVIGTLIGAWQGYWIAFVRIPPFITTLSGMLVFRGLSNVVLNGLTVSLNSETFIKIFGGGANCFVPDFFGVEGFNLTCMLAGILAAVIYILLKVKGRMNRVKKGYEVDPLSGMLTIARMTSAQPTYGQNYEMDAIGSCFIGGASAYGGVGTVPGVIVGAILMGVINLGMSIMGVDANYQRVVKGLVLLAAVIFDVVSKREAQK